MGRKEADLRCCAITQDLLPEHWAWTDDEVKHLKMKNVREIGEIIKSRLEAIGCELEDFYIILHDKDRHEVWDEVKSEYVLEYKTNHIHAYAKFKAEKGATLSAIATAVGIEPQYIEKAGKGKYGYDNLLSYPTHIKYPDKHQYDPHEVITLCGRKYVDVYMERKTDWEKGRAKIQADKVRADIDWLEEMILTGKVCKNQILLTDEFYNIYARNKRRCDDALDTYFDRKAYKTIQAMENGEFKLSVIFITGRAGSGKSYFTDQLVQAIKQWSLDATGEMWEACGVASSNPFDDYRGEEILVMDDLRGVSLDASAWLKLLDNDRVHRLPARYRNKQRACRVILINSEKDVTEFFYYVKNAGHGNRTEAMDQFFRRIMARVQVYRIDDCGNRIESGLPEFEERRVSIGELERTNTYEVVVGQERLPVNFAHLPQLSINGQRVDISMLNDYAINSLVQMIAERNGIYRDEAESMNDADLEV